MSNINNKHHHQLKVRRQHTLNNDLKGSEPNIDIVKSSSHQISKQAIDLSPAIRQNNPNLQDLLDLGNELDATSVRYSSAKKQFLEQEDFKRETALYKVILDNNLNALKWLLECGANVFHKNKMQQLAIDLAYRNRAWSCFLALIKFGSLFPKDFNSKLIPTEEFELWNIIKNKNKILELIASGNLFEVRTLTEEGSITESYMDICNQSAIIIAFSRHKYEIFVFLRSRGFNEHWHESPVNISHLSSFEKSSLKNVMALFVKSL